MGKITSKKRLEYCYGIYEQIYHENTMSICEIAQNTGLSRNTVAKYLKKMYEKDMLQGPCLRITPTETYLTYVYLMQFDNPYTAFQRFKGFPHVVYCAYLFGDWNIMVITDKLLDLSRLVGFKEMVFRAVRGVSNTPEVDLISWKKSVHHAEEYLHNFEPKLTPNHRNVLPDLPWRNQEWKLFSAFHGNVRKKITPVLRELEVRYEEYRAWRKGLDVYCTSHLGFYPEGYTSYEHHCFLISTEYEPQVREIFSFFPTSSFFMEVGKYLLVIVSVPRPRVTRWLYCMINEMKAHKMIKKFWYAHFLFHTNLRGLNLQKNEP
jgi:hypothetical protein